MIFCQRFNNVSTTLLYILFSFRASHVLLCYIAYIIYIFFQAIFPQCFLHVLCTFVRMIFDQRFNNVSTTLIFLLFIFMPIIFCNAILCTKAHNRPNLNYFFPQCFLHVLQTFVQIIFDVSVTFLQH